MSDADLILMLRKRIREKKMQILRLDEEYDAQRIQRHAWETQRAQCDRLIKEYQDQLNELTQPAPPPVTSAQPVSPLIAAPSPAGTRRVFVSYAWRDGARVARWLYERFNNTAGWWAWMDLQLHADTVFNHELQVRIDSSDLVVVVVSPDVNRPDTPSFVQKELYYATQPQVNKPVFAVKATDCAIPLIISGYTYVDFFPEAQFDSAFTNLIDKIDKSFQRGEATTPVLLVGGSRRNAELAYLREVAKKHTFWAKVYVDAAAEAEKRPLIAQVEADDDDIRSYLTELAASVTREKGFIEEPRQQREVQTFDALTEALGQFDRVAIIGDPGAGKTTTLRRFAHELAIAAQEALEAADDATITRAAPLPVFVPLGAFREGKLVDYIGQQFGKLNLADYLPDRVVVLLDGLNETALANVTQVQAWLDANPAVRVLLTCRTLDYVQRKLNLQRVDVLPLDVLRIRDFMAAYGLSEQQRHDLIFGLMGQVWVDLWRKWREAGLDFDRFWQGDNLASGHPVYSKSSGEQDKLYNTLRASMRAGKHDYPALLGLVRNPFLLTLTIAVYAEQGSIPANRAQLFAGFTRNLFDKRGKPAAQAQRIAWVDESIQQNALAKLAHAMTADNRGTSVPVAWAREVVGAALPGQDAHHLLYLAASASLIDMGSEVRFTHQLLQEYFAAFEMQLAMQNGQPATDYFPGEDWWQPTGWEETALLLAGMTGDSTAVVRWLTPVQPTLAYRCATESGAPCDDDALQALYEPATGARRDPIARAAWGRILAERGDPRKGVGVWVHRGVTLPDIDWVEIPDDGEWIYQNEKHPGLPAFSISRYLITYRQYQCFIDDPDGYRNPEWWQGLAMEAGHNAQPREQAFKYDNHPRDSVSWYEAIAFCRWFSARLGGPYDLDDVVAWRVRLPTEQEWEKAARGTDGRDYPWGNDFDARKCNSSVEAAYRIGQTSAVGLYVDGASPYGVLDMSGNVDEWCLNGYDDGSLDLRTDVRRVLRGGSWNYSNAVFFRVAFRVWVNPHYWDDHRGFRISLS